MKGLRDVSASFCFGICGEMAIVFFLGGFFFVSA